MTEEIRLLKASLGGDTTAFEKIVYKYQSLVCAITFCGTGRLDISEDLAQETFLRAWHELFQLKELEKFRPWLCSIARNLLRNHYRTTAVDRTSPCDTETMAQMVSTKSPNPSEQLISREEEMILSQALMQIPEEYREPLVLYYRQQQSTKEVAENLDLNEATVRTRLSRGRQMLKDQVATMVERTLEKTGPSKKFTKAVMVAIGGGLAAGTAATAASVNSSTAAGGASVVLTGVAIKVAAIAAAVLIVTGAMVYYYRNPSNLPGKSLQTDIVEPVATETKQEMAILKEPAVAITENTTAPHPTLQKIIHESADQPQPKPDLKTSRTEPNKPYEFTPRGILSGLITDVNTLEPVFNVKVNISSSDHSEYYYTMTDPNGFYYFEKIKHPGVYTIQLEAEKYITWKEWETPQEAIQINQDKQTVKHFYLQKGCVLNIHVTDEQNNPIKGVVFCASYVSDDIGRGPKEPVRSDMNGNAAIQGLSPSEYIISTMHHDYAYEHQKIDFKNTFQNKSVQFQLKTGFSVHGKALCSDGYAAAGWELSPEPTWWHSTYSTYSFPIQQDGSFLLDHILPGDYNIGVFMPEDGGSRGIWNTKIKLLPEQDFLEITIPKSSSFSRVSISGKLKLPEGQSNPGTWIFFTDDFRNHGSFHLERGQNDFVIKNLIPGLYTIEFSNFKDVFNNITIPCDPLVLEIGNNNTNSNMRLIRGNVIDKYSRESINKFQITNGGPWIEINHPQGYFELQNRDDKGIQLRVKADGYVTKTSQDIGSDINEPIVIELGIGGAIKGKVLDESGKAIPGAMIQPLIKSSNEQDILFTDPNGGFRIQGIPTDDIQSFNISHPGYASEKWRISVEDAITQTVTIVLKKGGVIEGYVYNDKGLPLPNTTLYFLDESQYSYWKDDRNRLCSVKSDPNGFYSIRGMPERLCFGFREEPDQQKGVVCASILPENGNPVRLDFGGTYFASGQLVSNNTNVAHIQLVLRGAISPNETAFTANAVTDEHGYFVFWGIPDGRRYLYYSIPPQHSLDHYIELGQFDFVSGHNLDLGVIEMNLSEVSISISSDDPNETLHNMQVFVQKYDKNSFNTPSAEISLPRSKNDDPYSFSHLTPGKYEAIVTRPNCPVIRKPFEVQKTDKILYIPILLPSGHGSLSGNILNNQSQSPVILRSVNQEITMLLSPSADGKYSMHNLPARDYIIGMDSVAYARNSTIETISLGENEQRQLDIKLQNSMKTNSPNGYLIVLVVNKERLPLPGTKVWLQNGTRIINSHFDTDVHKSLSADPGEYTLYAEYPGYRTVQKRVFLKSSNERTPQETFTPLVITMEKE